MIPRLPLGLAVLCTIVLYTRGPAQDARFSQFTTTPLLNNPALTGVMNGQLRFTANYQELFTTVASTEAYRSVGGALEIRRPAGNGNFFGLGAHLQHDRAGSSDFVRSQGGLSASYQQQLSGGRRGRGAAHFLSGGAQVGFGQRGFDFTKLWFSEQYFVDETTREAYLDRDLSNGEPFGGRGGRIYLDVNAGLAWFANLGERSGAYLGVAAYHLTEPNISPVPDSPDRLDRRYTAMGGGELPLGVGYTSVLPSFRIMSQGPSFSAMAGGSLRYTERAWREIALRVGGWAQLTNRSGDRTGLGAFVVAAVLETERLQFGASYDINTGDLSAATDGRGGFEISVIYVQPANFRQRVICPKF